MSKGFTLIDLVIAFAILAIIAAFALPSYQGMVRKSRRNEAMQMMAKIQLAEEKWRANNNSYSNALAAMGFNLAGNVLKTEYGNYQLIVSAPAAQR
jgi:type IV pilus assembly protein PilE